VKEILTKPPLIDLENEFNAYQLYNAGTKEIPKLLDPFLQTTGLASVVGESDSGKSTFLRQLAISIVLKLDNFLGFKLNGKTNKVIYVSTEDDPDSIRFGLKKQVDSIISENNQLDLKLLENIRYIFDTNKLLENLTSKLNEQPVDLIIIDAFADVFDKELNANTQVRNFLNSYDKLAKKHNCLIVFLHHITKSGSQKSPSKNNIIGSQGFEAKMRVVLEIRPIKAKQNEVKLMVLKGNFMRQSEKNRIRNLKMSDKLIFKKVGDYNPNLKSNNESNSKKTESSGIPKSKDPKIIARIKELKEEGLTDRVIADRFKAEGISISKSTVNTIVQANNFQAKPLPKP
jgi:archaellum biogenesis ATPase FlaH